MSANGIQAYGRDGQRLALSHLGGSGDVLFILHANGFGGKVYKPMVRCWLAPPRVSLSLSFPCSTSTLRLHVPYRGAISPCLDHTHPEHLSPKLLFRGCRGVAASFGSWRFGVPLSREWPVSGMAGFPVKWSPQWKGDRIRTGCPRAAPQISQNFTSWKRPGSLITTNFTVNVYFKYNICNFWP